MPKLLGIKLQMQNLVSELQNQADLDNDPRWMPVADGIEALHLMLDLTHGSWAILVKAKAGVKMQTHYHPTGGPYVFTVKGRWHYSEHDWEASTGHFLYESPGELHTPVFLEDTILYSVFTSGIILYVDNNHEVERITDVYTHYHAAKAHYQKIGLSPEDLTKIVR